jgi:membrane associated rhomboid family serine protease
MIRVKKGDTESVCGIREFERRVRQGEIGPNTLVCIASLTGDRFVPAREIPLFLANYDARRANFRRHFRISRFPILTGLLVLTCVVLYFVARHFSGGEVNFGTLVAMGAKSRSRIIEDGDGWRLLMANLLHRDWLHLAFNCFALFSVGSVLEGTFRRSELVLLWVFSGLVTMTTSLFFTPGVTVGASGLAFGCLGCALVFGMRYREILPRRHRYYFGVILLSYTVGMFYLGLLRSDTDNWGHAGGILAGGILGVVYSPMLLRPRVTPGPWFVRQWPRVATAAMVILAAISGRAFPLMEMGKATFQSPTWGIRLDVPAHWYHREGRGGFDVFENDEGTRALLSCKDLVHPIKPQVAAEHFVSGDLGSLARSGRIATLRTGQPTATRVGDAEVGQSTNALHIDASFVARQGQFEGSAYIFTRGYLECVLFLAHQPFASANGKRILEDIRLSLRLVQTEAQREARREVEKRPWDWSAHLKSALAHQRIGDAQLARIDFSRAVELVERQDAGPPIASVLLARARFELEMGGDLDQAVVDVRLAAAQGTHRAEAETLLALVLAARDEAR